MRKILLLIMGGIFSIYDSSGQTASYSVIPSPQLVKTTGQDSFHLKENTTITYPKGNELLKRNAEFLSEYIRQATGNAPAIHTYIKETRANNAIILALDPTIKNKEGYILVTTSRGIRISGQTANGVFYGIQTLRKTIPATVTTDILLPAGEIKDEPRFSYRGMHLDVCRHFYPVEFVKRYIDLLALHNMNTFHWHLTEDQGWRIEIKKFPKLTEVGSIRNKTVIGKAGSGKYDNTPYGGFYTQEQAKDIVKYAQERFITVIPEIDLPGHMLAALAAYPELGCTGGPYEVCPDWGIFDDVLCIGNDKTLPFLEGILAEIIEIFPSKYIHIGGDEAPRTRWKECSKCQARIKNEGLKADKEHTAEDRLQTFCMTHIEKFLNGKGQRPAGAVHRDDAHRLRRCHALHLRPGTAGAVCPALAGACAPFHCAGARFRRRPGGVLHRAGLAGQHRLYCSGARQILRFLQPGAADKSGLSASVPCQRIRHRPACSAAQRRRRRGPFAGHSKHDSGKTPGTSLRPRLHARHTRDVPDRRITQIYG